MLTFLKELPNAYLVAFVLLTFLGVYVFTRDERLLPILIGLIGTFSALCVPRAGARSGGGVSADIEKAEIAVTPNALRSHDSEN